MQAKKMSAAENPIPDSPVIGVFTACDPRIDEDSRTRSGNIIKMTADIIAEEVKMPDNSLVPVVYSDILPSMRAGV